MKQKRIRNSRYKDFTKQQLLDLGVEVYLDNVPTSSIPTEGLKLFYYDYKTIRIEQWSKREKTWIEKVPHPNTKAHDKGIIGECTYYQISLSKPMKDHPNRLNGFGIPMHRLVYVWFNDIIKAYNDNDEKMEICHIDGDSSNNHITNLTWDTAKNNRAMRRGAVNQYGERKEKYGKDLLHEKIWADPTKKH